MRMLCWMREHTIKDLIRNEFIRDKVGVTPIVKKMTRVEETYRSSLRKVDQMDASAIPRGEGRQRKSS
ncbi:hypothetical protein Lal_00045327 [Lupinus albus]|nr:hypothetical protein Lal_00045327 [Lupinus albus]